MLDIFIQLHLMCCYSNVFKGAGTYCIGKDQVLPLSGWKMKKFFFWMVRNMKNHWDWDIFEHMLKSIAVVFLHYCQPGFTGLSLLKNAEHCRKIINRNIIGTLNKIADWLIKSCLPFAGFELREINHCD